MSSSLFVLLCVKEPSAVPRSRLGAHAAAVGVNHSTLRPWLKEGGL